MTDPKPEFVFTIPPVACLFGEAEHIQQLFPPGWTGDSEVWAKASLQWEGSWLDPGVDPRAAYRYTHFVGVRRGLPEGDDRGGGYDDDAIFVYDGTPNAWLLLDVWSTWCPVLWPKMFQAELAERLPRDLGLGGVLLILCRFGLVRGQAPIGLTSAGVQYAARIAKAMDAQQRRELRQLDVREAVVEAEPA